jgi:hypothetical protein
MGSILSIFSSKPEQATDRHHNYTKIKGDGNVGGSNFNVNVKDCKN